jgi:hypothetical protein
VAHRQREQPQPQPQPLQQLVPLLVVQRLLLLQPQHLQLVLHQQPRLQ